MPPSKKGKERASAAAVVGTTSDANLTITAQQSRFYHDAVDAPVSREVIYLDSQTIEGPAFSVHWLTLIQVLVKDLSISINDREIISHADLSLKEGRRYVLVGRNGTGKSSTFSWLCLTMKCQEFFTNGQVAVAVLRAIAQGGIPGIAWNLRILLLGQTRQLSSAEEEGLGRLRIGGEEEETVLRHVVKSDVVRERLLREAECESA